MHDWCWRGRGRSNRRDGNRTTFARHRPGAGNATRLVVVVHRRLGRRCADLWRRCRLSDTNWLWFGLRNRDRLGDHRRLRSGDDGFRLRFNLDSFGSGLLGGSFLDRGVGLRVGWGGLDRRCLAGSSLLCRSLLDRLDFLGLLFASQTLTERATFKPIGLRFDKGARVGLHTHTHGVAQRHHFGICHSELLGELVHSHVFRQNQFSLSLASACRSLFRQPLSLSCW